MGDILVRELRDEHRDREWVDAYGYHWAWCEDAWVWHPMGGQWIRPTDPNAHNLRRDGHDYGPGPFMEALHYRVIYGGR
jgi:hypothetical protein